MAGYYNLYNSMPATGYPNYAQLQQTQNYQPILVQEATLRITRPDLLYSR